MDADEIMNGQAVSAVRGGGVDVVEAFASVRKMRFKLTLDTDVALISEVQLMPFESNCKLVAIVLSSISNAEFRQWHLFDQ